jgi:hypothetical protein
LRRFAGQSAAQRYLSEKPRGWKPLRNKTEKLGLIVQAAKNNQIGMRDAPVQNSRDAALFQLTRI